jgi:CheY-like chemotaxis protein
VLKILLADDSNVAQRMGKEILSAEGFEVLTVSNGQAALKKLTEFLPDLIIADVFMPGTGGYDLCQFVKSDKSARHVPVILLVGAMEPYDPDEGRRVKADGVVTKPLLSSNLVSIVKNLLASAPPAAPPVAKKEEVSKSAAAEADAREAEMAKAAASRVAEEPAQELVTQKIEVPKEMADQPMAGFEGLLEPSSTPEVRTEPEVVAGSAAPEAAAVLSMEILVEATAQDIPAAFEVEFPVASEPEMEAALSEPAIAFEQSAPAAEPQAAPDRFDFPVAPADAGDEPASAIFPTFPGEAQEREAEPAPQMAMPVEEVALDTPVGVESRLAEAPAPAEVPAPPELRWIAEPVEVTEEEKKLFDEPKANWDELATMAEVEESPSAAGEIPVLSAVEEKLAESVSYVPDAEALPETMGAAPRHAVEAAEIERLVREAVDEMMPQIVDRIIRTVEIRQRREEE